MTLEASPARGEALEDLVERASNGDGDALEEVVRSIQGDVYGLAVRFLWHPDDAEDATQDILIRIVTRLGTFRKESRFRTWVYRVAANALKNMTRKRMEERAMSFEEFGRDLDEGLSDQMPATASDAERALLLEEVKIGCTLGMLLCLSRSERLAYILGEILELDHREAAEILDVNPAAFRKQLSRARNDVLDLSRRKCGLVHPDNACRCRRRAQTAVRLGRVDPEHLLHAGNAVQALHFPEVLKKIRKLEELQRTVALYRSHPEPKPRRDFVAEVRDRVMREEGAVDLPRSRGPLCPCRESPETV